MRLRTLKSKKALDYYLGGLLLLLLKPITIVLGKLLKRNHSLRPKNEIVFIKILGGGSLLVAYPAILGMRNKYPDLKFTLVTASHVKPFGEILGVFDQIHTIDDQSFPKFLISALRILSKCMGKDTVVDFEVYSRLTTVFSLMTFARNRINFYLESIHWRTNVSTHLIYFNVYSGSYFFYEQVAYLLDARPSAIAECRAKLLDKISPEERGEHISIGHACSDLGKERMLKPAEWLLFFKQRISASQKLKVYFLGSESDFFSANLIVKELKSHFPQIRFFNECGKRSLQQSVELIAGGAAFFGIDSSLLHFSRLLGIKSSSVWGPTSPESRLKPIPGLEEEIVYKKIHCSPCIHVTETPPCKGNNKCIQALFYPEIKTEGKHSLFTTL